MHTYGGIWLHTYITGLIGDLKIDLALRGQAEAPTDRLLENCSMDDIHLYACIASLWLAYMVVLGMHSGQEN